LTVLSRFSDWLFSAIKVLLFAIILVMTIAGFLQVATRYLLSTPLPWSEELTRYLFVWLTFFGSAAAVKKKAHINMELMLDKLPPTGKKIIQLIADAAFLGLSIFITVYGLKLSIQNWTQKSDAMGIPMTLPYLAIPIGGFIMAFFIFEIMLSRVAKQHN